MIQTVKFWAIVAAWAVFVPINAWQFGPCARLEDPKFLPFLALFSYLFLASVAGWMCGRHHKYSKGIALIASVLIVPWVANQYVIMALHNGTPVECLYLVYPLKALLSLLLVIAVASIPFLVALFVGRRVRTKRSGVKQVVQAK